MDDYAYSVDNLLPCGYGSRECVRWEVLRDDHKRSSDPLGLSWCTLQHLHVRFQRL